MYDLSLGILDSSQQRNIIQKKTISKKIGEHEFVIIVFY